MTDETELTIAGVTSLHVPPRFGSEGGLITMSRGDGPAAEAGVCGNRRRSRAYVWADSLFTSPVDNGSPFG